MRILETSELDSRHAIAVLSNASGKWLVERVTEFSAYDAWPALAVDTDGSLWLAFSGGYLGDCTGCEPGPVFVATNSSGKWTEPLVVGDGEFFDPSIVAANGVVHLVYQYGGYRCGEDDEGQPGPNCGALHATNSSGRWITQQLEAVTNRYPDTDIALGVANRPSIAFGTPSGIVLAEAVTETDFSFDTLPDSAPLEWGPNITLAIGPGGAPAVLATERDADVPTSRLFHRTDGVWKSAPVELEQQRFSFTRDATGEPHFVAWYDAYDGPPGLWQFQGWEPGGLGTQLTTDDIGTAVIASGPDGRLHVVYGNADGTWYVTMAVMAG